MAAGLVPDCSRIAITLIWHRQCAGHRSGGRGLSPASTGRIAHAPAGHAPAPVRHESEEHTRATLDQAVRQVYPDPAAAGVQTRIAYGHPSQALVEASKEASLLVVGSRGQGAFTGMLLGSVSMHCVTGAFCPVTVVRHS